MDGHNQNDWTFNNNAHDDFDDLWSPDLGAFDFQAAMDDTSYAMPATASDLTSMPLVDELDIGNMTFDEPTYNASNTELALDTLSLQQLVMETRPLPPRQRALPRRRSKYTLRRSGSRTRPVAIPTSSQNESPVQSLAIQRWENSPPEDEAASLSAIYNAMEQRPGGISRGNRTPSFEVYRNRRGPSSTTSLESGVSESSVHSNQSGASQSRRGRVAKPRAKTKGKPKDAADRIFKCTFCCDSFKHKYDWARHEKSLHLNMEEWVCTPHGSSVLMPETGRVHCAYCSALDPTEDHLQSHNHSACHDGQSTPRTFRRKDHLVQHLRLVHALDTLPLIENWKAAFPPIVSRCGFCDAALSTWDERTDHLGAHFRSGKTMKDWRGDHGFDDETNARLHYDYPPYLIHHQSMTLVPFSVTNPESIDHTQQTMTRIEQTFPPEEVEVLDDQLAQREKIMQEARATSPLSLFPDDAQARQQVYQTRLFSDVLVRHLARYARQQMMLGVIPTDDMFQRESRRVLYNEADDDWNQTVADDPEWMRQFREQAGFGGNS